jgi:SWI/SNF chromatin-remodeling complex subunit SWI1
MTNGVPAPPEPAEQKDKTLYVSYVDYFGNRFGGFDPDRFAEMADVIHLARPPFRSFAESDPLDVRAVGLGIQCGITREVCFALNALLAATRRQFLQLAQCEDLLDILVDCAQTQVERLAENSKEISDVVEFPSYEAVVRNIHADTFHLTDPPEFGSSDYDKETAANQLLTITAILRNLSFHLPMSKQINNNQALTSPLLIKFISNTIRLIGTRDMLLGTNINTAYFMIDVVVLLSNVAANNIPHSPANLQIPSREHASNLLHFLLAFAPQPDPTSAEELHFTFYHPRINRYYPLAIDTFAKLLVSSDSNRAHFKAVMTEPSPPRRSQPQPLGIHQQYSLLTRTFGFAIATLPDRNGLQPPDEILIQKREATLRNGLLAADVVAGLLPMAGPAAAVAAGARLARAWLNSSSFWLLSMTHLCHTIFNGQGMRGSEFGLAIVNRALGIMYTLATVGMGKRARKAGDGADGADGAGKNGVSEGGPAEEGAADDAASADDGAEGEANGGTDKAAALAEALGAVRDGLPMERLPNHEFVVGALNMSGMDHTVLRILAALARLNE